MCRSAMEVPMPWCESTRSSTSTILTKHVRMYTPGVNIVTCKANQCKKDLVTAGSTLAAHYWGIGVTTLFSFKESEHILNWEVLVMLFVARQHCSCRCSGTDVPNHHIHSTVLTKLVCRWILPILKDLRPEHSLNSLTPENWSCNLKK